MSITQPYELEGLQKAAHFVSHVLQEMKNAARAGMTTIELDQVAARLFAEHGAQSAPQITYNFPGYTCISVNKNFAHGIPDDTVIRPGDLLNIDVSASLDGYFADTGHSFQIKPYSEDIQKLCLATLNTLKAAMQTAKAGASLNQIGRAIEQSAQKNGYATIRNLCSHGVGKALHEWPGEILNYWRADQTQKIHSGLVITLEPFLSTGASHAVENGDGWTLTSREGSWVAQHEHTLVIAKGKPLVLTRMPQ